ncbi:hypothetical protein ASC65_13265, partial [Brevundimonas sp. Root1279]
MRGLAADYTVTVEGAGYRIVDKVAGRDGSTFVTSIEVIRWSNNAVRTLGYRIVDKVAGRDGSTFVTSIEVIRWSNNAVRTLSYPPVAASIGEAEGKGGPEVSPLLSADAAAKDG